MRKADGGDTVVLVISTLITVPVLFWLDWRLALITCLLLPVVIVAIATQLPKSISVTEELSRADLNIANTVQDTFRAQQVVRTFHLEETLTGRFDELLAAQEAKAVRQRGVSAVVGKGSSLGVLLVQLVVIVVGAELAVHGDLGLSSLIAFVIVLGVLTKNVFDFTKTDMLLLRRGVARGQRLARPAWHAGGGRRPSRR